MSTVVMVAPTKPAAVSSVGSQLTDAPVELVALCTAASLVAALGRAGWRLVSMETAASVVVWTLLASTADTVALPTKAAV
ncbi:hypothetical protein [Arthrobacter alpinus]|uniref:hypothetical protein n=1 Tax=Arthrobacter alpinus TaxID=656366 RepID=UPI0016461A40|nr:hypothetical protein [Arthrobacter alpinus]